MKTITLGGYILGIKAVSKDTVALSVSMVAVTLFRRTFSTTVARQLMTFISDAVTEAEKMP